MSKFHVEPSASRACWPPGHYKGPVWTPPDASTESIVSRFDPEFSRRTLRETSALTTGPVPGTGLDTVRCVDRTDRVMVRSGGFTWNQRRAEDAGLRQYQAQVWKPSNASTESIVSRFDPEVSRGTICKPSVLATRSVPGTDLETARCVERVDRVTVRSKRFHVEPFGSRRCS